MECWSSKVEMCTFSLSLLIEKNAKYNPLEIDLYSFAERERFIVIDRSSQPTLILVGAIPTLISDKLKSSRVITR